MDPKEYSLHILMLPWLAHGHISPYLELAKRLSKYNFHIHICSTPITLSSIKDKVSYKTFPSIELVEIHLPTLPNLPPHYHTTKSLPSHLMPTLKEAFDMVQPSFSNLLTSLKPDLVIYDLIQPWAPEIASQHSIPAITFSIFGVAPLSYLFHLYKNPGVKFPFPNIYLEEDDHQEIVQMNESNMGKKADGERFLQSFQRSSRIALIKTCKVLEAKYIDYMSNNILGGKEILPVGALVPEPEEPINTTTNTNKEGKQSEYFISWLDKREKCSTVFVSFGSEYFMPSEEIEEIAYGLELSGVSFIWVIRFHEEAKTREVEQALPKGYLDRVREKGLVVEGWAPQLDILQHSSIGGFVTHLGWSSVMEGIRYSVPLIGMPMQLDQPLNARLVVDELGVGVEVKRRGGKVDRAEMAKVIKEVVVEKGGEEVKKKMKKISEKIIEGGEMEMVVAKILELCDKSGPNEI